MSVRLFIENTEVELTDDVQFAITKEFEDTSKPTDIINDWSKTVSIPFTHNNNILFGHIYSPDKVIVDGGTVGIYFNPLLKLDFRLEWNESILITGYAKMNEVKQNNGKGTYEITLFGQLGKLFQEMQKITFDNASSDSDYYIDGSEYVDEYITKDLVYNSWTSSGQTTSVLKKKTDSGYSVTDIIGFAPNNAFSNDFKYDTYQNSDNVSIKFTDLLESQGFTSATGIKPDTVIPNGLLPREIGEYRSYYQLPFIYWNKLFQIFQQKAQTLTGYDFVLDDEWFSNSNPYWHDLVFMLRQKDISKGSTYTNTYTEINDGYNLGYWQFDDNNWTTPCVSDLTVYGAKSEQKRIIGNDNKTYYFGEFNTIAFEYDINSMLIANHTGQTMATSNELIYIITAIGQNGHTESITKTFTRDDCEVDGIYIHLPLKTIYFNCNKNIYGTWVKFQISTKWESNHYPYQNIDYTPAEGGDVRVYTGGAYGISLKIVINGNDWARSNAEITLNDLWNNEYNLFEQILNYCKMYRIGVFADSYNKKLYFTSFGKYFSEYSVVDWTEKIDKSKDYVITPVTFDSKYVLFNYKDSDTKLGKEYKDKYGVNYGDYRLVTEYNFNTDTTEIFKDITPSIVNTDTSLSWTNLRDYQNIVYSFPSEIMVYNKDKDKKEVSLFGAYFFHNGLANFSTESALHMHNVILTDDTPYMDANNTYFYNQGGGANVRNVTTYPKLDVVMGDNLCVFNIPKYNYTYNNNYSGKKSIYTNFWEDYINEKYNVQNKKITCYLHIKPTDYISFDFNKFIKVGNQLCLLNKIYDYDVTNNESTKVDLITIQNIDGYTDNAYIDAIDTISLSWSSTLSFDGTTGQSTLIGTFDSLTDVTFADGNLNYSTHGIYFSISNNEVYATKSESYVDDGDVNFTVVLKNQHNTASFNCVRYSIKPYPYISISDGDGNIVTSIPSSSVLLTTYKLNWECTDSSSLDNKPTVSITVNSGTDRITINTSTWAVESKQYTEEGTTYNRYKYSVRLQFRLLSGNTQSFTVNVTDVNGWHAEKTYNIT